MTQTVRFEDPAMDRAQPWWTRHNVTFYAVHVFWTVRGHR
jgi:hypothetical protein